MRILFGSLFIIIFGALGFIAWAAFPWSLSEKKVEGRIGSINPDVEHISDEEHPSVLKILTFNLGFLYGEGSEGPGYEHREKEYYEKALAKLAEEVKEWGADIVCLQEIDFESSRSGDINQAEFIAQKAGYPYYAEATSWDANYIPFPYWPLKNNFGRMNSGGAILSRFPITKNEVILLKKPDSQPWWYNLFYLHRYLQEVSIEINDREFKFINLHLEAFDTNDRQEQIKRIVSEIKDKKIDFITGDFNMLPPSASKRSKFFNEDNYENDPSYENMLKSGLLEVIPDEIYAKDESSYFTFPAWKPDRRLDYIWYRPELKMMKAEVLNSASSDHLPLRATFQISGPNFNPYSQ